MTRNDATLRALFSAPSSPQQEERNTDRLVRGGIGLAGGAGKAGPSNLPFTVYEEMPFESDG